MMPVAFFAYNFKRALVGRFTEKARQAERQSRQLTGPLPQQPGRFVEPPETDDPHLRWRRPRTPESERALRNRLTRALLASVKAA